MKVFAERLRKRRKELNLTHVVFSQKTGLSRTQISHYELNKRDPRIDSLKAICQELDVSADYLLGLKD
jgi:transcriptional regulator with XRE-family HTH domain